MLTRSVSDDDISWSLIRHHRLLHLCLPSTDSSAFNVEIRVKNCRLSYHNFSAFAIDGQVLSVCAFDGEFAQSKRRLVLFTSQFKKFVHFSTSSAR